MEQGVNWGREKSPVAQVLFLLLIISMASISFLYWEESSSSQSKMRSYLDVVYRVATVVGILSAIYMIQFSYAATVHEDERNVKVDVEQGMVEIQKIFLNPATAMELSPLYAEMNPGFFPSQRSESMSPLTQAECAVGNIIFRKVETVLNYLGEKVDQPGSQEWLRVWRVWFQSKRLCEIWRRSAKQYSSQMQTFIETRIMSE
jgi:hypothetical protein